MVLYKTTVSGVWYCYRSWPCRSGCPAGRGNLPHRSRNMIPPCSYTSDCTSRRLYTHQNLSTNKYPESIKSTQMCTFGHSIYSMSIFNEHYPPKGQYLHFIINLTGPYPALFLWVFPPRGFTVVTRVLLGHCYGIAGSRSGVAKILLWYPR